ncbi:MAG: hypothetical protein U0990_09515 [Candidatus Nanopelagicales bacterium]|nr:hypothetical protein [Candidatus Nanopelagicales bacterium]
MIAVPASILKADIARCGALKGTVSARQLSPPDLLGREREFRYLGFAGSLDAKVGRYVGHHRFELLKPGEKPEPLGDFDAIPGLTGASEYGVRAQDIDAGSGGRHHRIADGDEDGG